MPFWFADYRIGHLFQVPFKFRDNGFENPGRRPICQTVRRSHGVMRDRKFLAVASGNSTNRSLRISVGPPHQPQRERRRPSPSNGER